MVVGMFTGAGEVRDEPPVSVWYSVEVTAQGLWGTDFPVFGGARRL